MDIQREAIWRSFDIMCEVGETNLARLALYAGLDQSTLQKSRREDIWPTLRTIAAILNAYDVSLERWCDFVEEAERRIMDDLRKRHGEEHLIRIREKLAKITRSD